jgi:hypothetical protein
MLGRVEIERAIRVIDVREGIVEGDLVVCKI